MTDNCRYGENLQIWGAGAGTHQNSAKSARKVGQCLYSQSLNSPQIYLSEDSKWNDDGNAPFMHMKLQSGSFISFIIILLVWGFSINLGFTLMRTTIDNQLFYIQCFHMVSNNSSLFISMSNSV